MRSFGEGLSKQHAKASPLPQWRQMARQALFGPSFHHKSRMAAPAQCCQAVALSSVRPLQQQPPP